MNVVIRTAQLPEDSAEILAVDRRFGTREVLRVELTGDTFALTTVPLAEELTKEYEIDPLDDPERDGDHVLVAEVDGRVRGFLSPRYDAWNRRLVISEIFVDAACRGAGAGHALVERATEYGRSRGATHVWLETSNVNVPGVRAYRRMGFELCGLDTRLYEGTPDAGEVALFLARSIS
ncbi:GNAT family N-acetyltransferase [Allokutzneria oryzae]|uniref:GNAT family N-acetyltransferase n=1 Tax=Allokutzneria oryzae TaxID=1378989 RepID=A0ABV6A0W7_9PSEU